MNATMRTTIIEELEGANWVFFPAMIYLLYLTPFSHAGQGGGTNGWLMLWVLLAAGHDLACRRIPNALCLMALVSGFMWSFWMGGAMGFLNGFLGCITGFAIMFVLYLFGMMGGGDVKIIAALSAFLTPVTSVHLIVLTFISGGVLALLTLFYAGEIRQLILLAGGLKNMKIIGTGLKMPYGLAIAMGVISLIILKGIGG